MFTQALAGLQNEFFSGLNQLAEPLIRAGLGNPLLWPMGTIVVETVGRKTGRKINIPVLATRIGEFVVFSTVRRHSQWVKNLAAVPEVRYWLAGQPREATAFVFTPDKETSAAGWPPGAECLAQFLHRQSRLSGISFALLTSRLAR
ncbi:MAG TPA: nitroreductase/quinone reductase family protein [Blastocatellia bacterium]|nr:nitroreductase/quinone reductase family protein [Blastocatellia bacterium]HMV83547.1 nitroreductase/quinone reductase family protein [Blastocatellia bacterium]HMX26765.1 nitroreductase/quinone reductase family protein [Blastocatellia bacterium]HMY73602.1 nitroreductase/quinone reductase family protein [Blastocatellia bacterium]HMZ17260.1 nitroreductase/quinone reductase family protein [Blastocatellia bacterium]